MSGNSEDSSLPMPIDPLNKDPFDQTSTLEKMDGYTIPKKVLDILDKANEKKQGDEKLIKTKKISRQSANDFLADDDSDGDSSMKDFEKSDGSKNVQDEEEMRDLEISDGSKNVQDEEETKVEKKSPVKQGMFRHALKQSETYSRARRNRLSAEIREKYKDDPEAVIHAAMMLVGQQNVNAQKVHKHILDDAKAGDSSQKDSTGNIRSRTSSENRTSSKGMPINFRSPVYVGLLQVLHFDGKSNELIKTEDISKNQAMKASEDFFITSQETGIYKRIRCIPCKKDFDKSCSGHLKGTGHQSKMRLHLMSENDPEGNKNVENPDEENSWLDRTNHEDRTSLYAGLLQVLHFDGKSDELVKTEDISKNQAMKASLSEDFFITSPETGMYKRIRCIPCKKDFNKQCAGHLKSKGHASNMRLRLTNENEPEENIKFESPEERSRITRSVDCIEILYYDGVTNEVFKRENMSKNQAMKVDEEFFRQDPESGVYKQIRCTVCEQNFTHPHPKHWHATGHRRNLRKLHESQESQALKDVKIQELTNSAGLLEVLTYETNTSGPMPLPYSGEEIPFSNSDDSKNWVEDISKKTEISQKEAKELDASFYKKDSETGIIRRIRCVACEQMIQSKDMLLSHLDGKRHGKNVYVYVASAGGEHLELEPQMKKSKLESTTPYFYQKS